MGRLVDDIRSVLREELEVARRDLTTAVATREERLRAEIHSVARQNLITTLTVIGVFNAVVFTALGLVLA